MRKFFLIISVLLISFSVYCQTPTPHATLQKVFPNTVFGAKLTGDIEGLTINIEGTAFSNAVAEYVKGKLDIKISIIDYVNANDMVDAMAVDLNKDLNYSDENSFAKTFLLDGKKGYIMGDKSAKTTTLILAWNNRFVLTINLTGKVSESDVKAIYKDLDLSILE
tara:strand:+ start:110799 stop:111293 length:495 start_codon:yes stop_codon:yes gene_type:complete